jgi:phosphatidylserine decarboxylase
MACIIESDNQKIGKIGLLFIGMAECSGVSNSVFPGDTVKQGDHLGNFVFGGSSYVMMF